MAQVRTLKVECEGDLRRFKANFPEEGGLASKLLVVQQAIRSGFDMNEDQVLLLKYKDDEGDMCTLVEATMEDFLSQPDGPLRLVASKSGQSSVEINTRATIATVSPKTADAPSSMQGVEREAITSIAPKGGCHSVGPWKLLMCLRSLRAAGLMSWRMVASMILQFLPILAQRAHRKQEKLNRLGPEKRAVLLPLLHSVDAHIELVEEAKPLKPALEDYRSGKDVSKFGDFVASLCKAFATNKDRQAVSEAIGGISPDLLASLPQLFPDLFGSEYLEDEPAIATHYGVSCSACSTNPIKGPRFHCAPAGIDICGECFIGQGVLVSEPFECLFEPRGASIASEAGSQGGNDEKASWAWKKVWWKAQKEEWKASKEEWKEWRKGWKGKGKGKGKGKCKWWWDSPASVDADQCTASNEVAGDTPSVPPGLDMQWWTWKGKGASSMPHYGAHDWLDHWHMWAPQPWCSYGNFFPLDLESTCEHEKSTGGQDEPHGNDGHSDDKPRQSTQKDD